MIVEGYTIYDKETGRDLATLPLTIPIGSSCDGFRRIGFQVGWRWTARLDDES